MLKNFFELAYRDLLRNKGFSLIAISARLPVMVIDFGCCEVPGNKGSDCQPGEKPKNGMNSLTANG